MYYIPEPKEYKLTLPKLLAFLFLLPFSLLLGFMFKNLKKITSLIIILSVVFSVQNANATNTYTTSLNGTNQYWTIAHASQTGLDIMGNFTIEAWIKTTDNGDYVVGFTNGSDGRGYGLNVGGAGAPAGKLALFGGAGWAQPNNTAINDGVWHHVAATYTQSSGAVAFYLDGSANGTGTAGTAPESYDGVRTIGGLTGTLAADIDDVRVWNVVRTSTEIANNYNCSLIGTESGLVGYWKFDNDGLDETTNNNDLTNNNSATFQSASLPFTATCGATTVQGEEYINIFE